jgi:hypothetical protein
MKEDVIGLEGGVNLQVTAPIAVFMLGGEEKVAGGIEGGAYAGG